MSSDQAVLQGRAPTDEETFYLDWGKRTSRDRLESLATFQRELVALDAILFGGSLVFFDPGTFPQSLRVPATLLFLASLIVSFFGAMPRTYPVDLRMPWRLREIYETMTRRKARALTVSGCLLVLGLVLVLLGTIRGR